jgi:hypothetical protein
VVGVVRGRRSLLVWILYRLEQENEEAMKKPKRVHRHSKSHYIAIGEAAMKALYLYDGGKANIFVVLKIIRKSITKACGKRREV